MKPDMVQAYRKAAERQTQRDALVAAWEAAKGTGDGPAIARALAALLRFDSESEEGAS